MPLNKFTEIEEREKKPMQEVIRLLYEELGSQTMVAERLGVSQGTVSLWLVKLGLVEKTIVVPRKEARQQA